MIEGIVVDILKVKWRSFIKKNFFGQIAKFAVYFLISIYCFVIRPVGTGTECVPLVEPNITTNGNWTNLDTMTTSILNGLNMASSGPDSVTIPPDISATMPIPLEENGEAGDAGGDEAGDEDGGEEESQEEDED